MATPTAPCGWLPAAPCSSGPCCPDTTDPIIQAQANAIASAIINRLTGFQFGCCEITVRPCKPRTCDPVTLAELIYWDSRAYLQWGAPNMGVLSFFPTLIGGEVFNIGCGCPMGCCTCEADCEVKLPGPICAVSDVTVDGVVLAPSLWRVMDGNTLIIASDHCPGCQDYNLAAGAVGTWTVTYTVGTPVPVEVNFAAGLYACEVAKALVNDKSCALPNRVQQVARQGTTVLFKDPTALVNAGLTGLDLVDQIIRAVNPNQLTQPPRVWFPGKLATVRRDTP